MRGSSPAEDRGADALLEELPEPHVVYPNVAWLRKASSDPHKP